MEIKDISLSAVLLDNRFVEGELDPKILKKYNIIKLELQNKTDEIIFLPSTIFYTTSQGTKYRTESPPLIFKKLKKHVIRRATIITVPVTILSLGILTIPTFIASYVYSSNYNSKLQATLQRNSYHSTAVPDSGNYEIFVLIPKKYKNLEKLIIENIKVKEAPSFNLETFIGKEYY
jgi:hypothetical protein